MSTFMVIRMRVRNPHPLSLSPCQDHETGTFTDPCHCGSSRSCRTACPPHMPPPHCASSMTGPHGWPPFRTADGVPGWVGVIIHPLSGIKYVPTRTHTPQKGTHHAKFNCFWQTIIPHTPHPSLRVLFLETHCETERYRCELPTERVRFDDRVDENRDRISHLRMVYLALRLPCGLFDTQEG